MSSIFDIFDNNAQTQAAQAQTQGIQTGLSQLQQNFGQGQQALNTNYAAALSPYTQNYAQAGQGATQYANALGLNGASGNAAAGQGFQNNPGYQFEQQQGINQTLAQQSKMGQLGSGNTDVALANYTTGLANQGWQNYITNLQPYLGQQNNAAQGIAAVNTGLGNQLNASDMTQGNAAYGANASIGNANANAALGNLNASANIMGVLGGFLGGGSNVAGQNSNGMAGLGQGAGNFASNAASGIGNLASSLFGFAAL